MNYGEGYSLSDIAAATGNSGNNNGFGGDGWWIIVFLIFALGGWGRNGFGGGYSGGSGVGENYVLATDFATIERKLDGVNAGLCDGFYAQNTNMLNGFSGLQNTLCQGFSGVNLAITNNGFATQNAINTLGYNLQDCCCKTQRAIDGVNYNLATNTCAITNNATMNTRDIIDAVNANYRSLHDEIVANRIEDKNAQIVAQQNEINALRLAASQEKQNNYLVSKLGPKCPEAAYVVNGPTPVNFPVNCYGQFAGYNGCGC